MTLKPLVVVLGAGYGGVRAALDLARKRVASVILIDRNPYHSLPTHLYEVATAFEPEGKHESGTAQSKKFHELMASAAIPLEDIFGHTDLVKLVRGSIARVDPETRRVILEGGRVFSYNYLVMAFGSSTNYFNIPHLENNSLGMKTINEAANARNRIDELFLSSAKHKKITVVVGGGGFTGVELACELVGYMKKLSQIHGHPMGNWNCVIVEAGPAVLGSVSPWVQKKVAKRLSKLGITVLCESPIVDVWPNLLYIGKEKRALTFDLLVWTAGVKGACGAGLIDGVASDKRNCISPDATLRIPRHEDIFVLGDMAGTLNPKTGLPVPMTAQKAIHEGRYVARAIAKLAKNPKAVLPVYTPKRSSFIIPLGGKYALLNTSVLRMSGFLPWALKYIVLLRYLRSILPLGRAVRILAGEIVLYTRND